MDTQRLKRTFALAAVLVAGLALASVGVAADDGKAKAAASNTGTNKNPWEISIPKSAFHNFEVGKKVYRDPFFPNSERIFPKPKRVDPPKPPTTTGNTAANTTNAVAAPTVPEVKLPAWHETFGVIGISGSNRLRFAQITIEGVGSYTFRQGQSLTVKTTGGSYKKVTCSKITDNTVEIKMEGEKESGVLELPSR